MTTTQNTENTQKGEASGAVVLNTNAKALQVGGLPCFDPKGDPNALSVRWRRWKRAFNLYMVSKGVTNEEQKVALLLHSGGM